MSSCEHQSHESQVSLLGRAWLSAMLGLMAACSGETPVTPPSHPQASVPIVQEKNYSFSITPADHTVRVRFTRVRSDGTETVSAFMRRMFASADSAGASRLVLDLRSTTGGDAFLLVPLLKGVLARASLVQRGGLVVIVGPESFSPGQNAASQLRRYADPIFVGEPIS
jgi:hypothetical protein